MKKIIFILVLLILSIFICNYTNKDKKIDIDYSINDDYILVYYLYNNDIVALKRARLSDNNIIDVFKYLSIYKNNSPLGYNSKIDNDNKINSYIVEDKTLSLYLKKEIDPIMNKVLLYSYKALGYDILNIIDNKKSYSLS